MSDASLSALSGVRASLAQMDASAARLAEHKTEPVTELVAQMSIKTDFTANIAALKTAGDIEGGIIRLWA